MQILPSTSNENCPDIDIFDYSTHINSGSDSNSDETLSPPPLKKSTRPTIYKSLPRNQCPSVCLVCRNQAVGYHYDVPSCNGCKTFFRRTIITGRQFVCLKKGNCIPDGKEPIDTSKRICRACRFEKCVQAGMNPLAIQADVKSEEGKELRNEILRKRSSSRELVTIKKFTTLGEKVNQVIEELLFVESKIEPVQKQGLPPGYRDLRTLEDVLKSRPIFSTSEIPNMVYAPPIICKRTGHMKRRCTSYIHSSFLATIEYSKTFEYNNEIDMNSKVALLRHGTDMCSILMNSFFSIHYLKSDKLVHPDGSVAGPPARKMIKYGDFYKTNLEMLQRTLIALLRNKIERIEYILLKAITLCNPAVEGLSLESQQVIEKSRQKFVQCLFSYCMFQHGSMNGPSRFTTLIAIPTVLENQQKYHKDFHTFLKAIHHEKHKTLEDPLEKRVSILFEEIMGN